MLWDVDAEIDCEVETDFDISELTLWDVDAEIDCEVETDFDTAACDTDVEVESDADTDCDADTELDTFADTDCDSLIDLEIETAFNAFSEIALLILRLSDLEASTAACDNDIDWLTDLLVLTADSDTDIDFDVATETLIDSDIDLDIDAAFSASWLIAVLILRDSLVDADWLIDCDIDNDTDLDVEVASISSLLNHSPRFSPFCTIQDISLSSMPQLCSVLPVHPWPFI